jgi:short-subunit dehydrogenase
MLDKGSVRDASMGIRLMDKARRLRDMAVSAALTGGDPLSVVRTTPSIEALRTTLGGKTLLVTGASSGIGRAVALKAAAAGAEVVLVARSEEKLRSVALDIACRRGVARIYGADLSDDASARRLLQRLDKDGVHVDFLVNNAGRSIRRPVKESIDRLHDYERTMAINYFGSLRLILGLLPSMRTRGGGHIVNVSSAGAQMSTPLFSAYVASKAALDAFTRVAASETKNDGVSFTTVYMPLVRTPMIAPTRAYRGARALTPEQAADLVLRPLVTGERQVGMRLASLFSLAHAMVPALLESAVACGHRLAQESERTLAPESSRAA